jgi:hypothetical protein
MNVHATWRGELQRYTFTAAGRRDASNAAAFARQLCVCPVCNRGAPRIYRTSVRSVTLQCGGCGLQWTMTWHMLGRSFDRAVKPGVDDEAGTVGSAVFERLAALETRGRAAENPQRGYHMPGGATPV